MKNKQSLILILALSCGFLLSAYSSAPLQLNSLRVEYHENPLGIDVEEPRFSWTLEGEGRNRFQTAYQLVVASTSQKLASGDWDVWDSKKVDADATNQIEFQGIPLQSGQVYYWKVKV